MRLDNYLLSYGFSFSFARPLRVGKRKRTAAADRQKKKAPAKKAIFPAKRSLLPLHLAYAHSPNGPHFCWTSTHSFAPVIFMSALRLYDGFLMMKKIVPNK